MKIAIASDHAGFQLKEFLVQRLLGDHELLDLGTFDTESVDYPDFAVSVGASVRRGEAERGILVCGTGIGMAIAANKLADIRAAVIHDTFSARVAVEHNDLNVLALGGRVVGTELAFEVVRAFLGARFAGGRHQRRLDLIEALERPIPDLS